MVYYEQGGKTMSRCTGKNCPLVGNRKDCDLPMCPWRTEEKMMTNKELIMHLLEVPMDNIVRLYIDQKHTDEYGIESNGYLFDIDSVDRSGLLVFTDWRDKEDVV